MPVAPAVRRGCQTLVLWLLPWISVLVVSTGIAYAINGAVTGPRPTHDVRQQETSLTPLIAGLPAADAVSEGNGQQVPGRSCVSLFGSYNWWLFSNDHHGPCGIRPDPTSTPVPEGLSPAGPM